MPKQKKTEEKIDAETTKVLTEGQRIESFVNSSDWHLIRKKLFSKLITIDSLTALPEGTSNEEFLREVAARRGAVSLVIEWIKEIEGTAANNRSVQEVFTEARRDSIVEFF